MGAWSLRMIGVLVAGLAACRSPADGSVLQQVKDLAEGRGRLAGFSLSYEEERPRELRLSVRVEGDGAVAVVAHALEPDCPRPWDRSCWKTRERREQVPEGRLRELLAALAATGLTGLPDVSVPPPGAETVQVSVAVADGAPVRFTTRLSAVTGSPPWARVRELVLDLAGDAAGAPPGGDIRR